jgi:hypothetical protein
MSRGLTSSRAGTLTPPPCNHCQTTDCWWRRLILAFKDTTSAIFALKLGLHRGLDLIPRQPSRQHCQGVVQVDLRVDASAEKVSRLHPRIPQKSIPQRFVLEGIGVPSLLKKACVHADPWGFAGPTRYLLAHQPITEHFNGHSARKSRYW